MKTRWPRLLLAAAALLALAGVVWLYLQPGLMVMLADMVWGCF